MAEIRESVRMRERRQLTLPKSIGDQFEGVDRFDVFVERGRIVLVPKVELDVSWYHSEEFQQSIARARKAADGDEVVEYGSGPDAVAHLRRIRAQRAAQRPVAP